MVEHIDVIAILLVECIGVACFVLLGVTGMWAASLSKMCKR